MKSYRHQMQTVLFLRGFLWLFVLGIGMTACSPFQSPRLQSAEFQSVSAFELFVSIQVPLAEVQVLLDKIESERFTALPEEGNELVTLVFLDALFDRVMEFPAKPLEGRQGPISSFALSVLVVDNTTDRVEVATLATYDSDPIFANTLFGADVSRKAMFEWQIEQTQQVSTFGLALKAEDGFALSLVAAAPEALGLKETVDPFELPVRFLSDGPNGSHPSFFSGLQRHRIDVAPENVTVVNDKLMILGTELDLLEVTSSMVARSRRDVIKLE